MICLFLGQLLRSGNVPKDCEMKEQTCEATVLCNVSQSFTKFVKRKKKQ
jgi:hypothetical protein